MKKHIITFLQPNKQKLIAWAILLVIASFYLLNLLAESFPPQLMFLFDAISSFLVPIGLVTHAPFIIIMSMLVSHQPSLIAVFSVTFYEYIIACLIVLLLGWIEENKKFPRKIVLLLVLLWIAFSYGILVSFWELLVVIPGFLIIVGVIKYLYSFDKRISLALLGISLYFLVSASFIAQSFFMEDYCNWVVNRTPGANTIVAPTPQEKKEGMSQVYLSQRVLHDCWEKAALVPSLLNYFNAEILKK